MKKGKILIVGLIGLLLVGTLIFTSCKGKDTCSLEGLCSYDENPLSKKSNVCSDSDCDVSKAKADPMILSSSSCDCN